MGGLAVNRWDANTDVPQRPDGPAVATGPTPDPGLSGRATPQDVYAGGARRRLLRPADRVPVAVPAQGLPAQEHRLAVLRRVAAQRHPGPDPRSPAREGPPAGG